MIPGPSQVGLEPGVVHQTLGLPHPLVGLSGGEVLQASRQIEHPGAHVHGPEQVHMGAVRKDHLGNGKIPFQVDPQGTRLDGRQQVLQAPCFILVRPTPTFGGPSTTDEATAVEGLHESRRVLIWKEIQAQLGQSLGR